MEIEKEVLFLSNVASLTSVDNLLLLEENIGSVRIEYRALSLGMQERSRRGKAYIGQKSMHGRHGTGKDSHSSILGSSFVWTWA